jgi:hypothetical protein
MIYSPHCCVRERRKVWMIVLEGRLRGKKKIMDDCDNTDWLVTDQGTARDKLVLRRERM